MPLRSFCVQSSRPLPFSSSSERLRSVQSSMPLPSFLRSIINTAAFLLRIWKIKKRSIVDAAAFFLCSIINATAFLLFFVLACCLVPQPQPHVGANRAKLCDGKEHHITPPVPAFSWPCLHQFLSVGDPSSRSNRFLVMSMTLMPFVWGGTAGDVEFYGRLGFFKVFSCSFKSSPSSFDNFSSAVTFCFFVPPLHGQF